MRVAAAQWALASSHTLEQRAERRERLEMWIGERPPAEPSAPEPPAATAFADLAARLARDARLRTPPPTARTEPATPERGSDPRLEKVLLILEKLFGVKGLRPLEMHLDTSSPGLPPEALGQAPRQGWGLVHEVSESYVEHESLAIAASGEVLTADGTRLAFSFSLTMERSFAWSSTTTVRAGDALLKDPLMLALDGPVRLSAVERMQVDLDGDGATESVARPEAGGLVLVHDRDGDGVVDGPDELFGPRSGDGFAELAALDQDGNGFIDEGDAAWGALRAWDGVGALRTLGGIGLGALGTAAVRAEFRLADAADAQLGQARSAGLWLAEDGRAGAVQQIDLVV